MMGERAILSAVQMSVNGLLYKNFCS